MTRRGRRPTRLALAAACLWAAAAAQAHGPSVEASLSGFRPERMTLAAGDTLHFRRASGSQLSLTVVSDAGLFESPALDAAGWHYTFETPGEYSFHLKERPSVRGWVRVGEARPEPPGDPHAGHDH